MANIYGALGIQEYQADQVYIQTLGYDLVYTVTQQYVARYEADLAMAMALFIEGTTENHSFRYKLPGGGRLQRRGDKSVTGAAKAAGSWDVALPLEDFGRSLSIDDVAFAYMTAAEYQRHIDGVLIANTNTVRFEVLRALFNSSSRTFQDSTLNTPTLTIQPLANGDATLYPPVLGSESDATDNHYLGSNYAASSISNTNDPFPTIVDELEEHFGVTTGGSNILVLINKAQTSLVSALSDFLPVAQSKVAYGDSTNLADVGPIPATMSARLLGTHIEAGCHIAEWAWVPAGYMLGIHLDAPRPLMMRVDPAATGLGRGLQLVARKEDWPNTNNHWRHRFGVGAGNRLNGVCLQLVASTTYTTPAAYT